MSKALTEEDFELVARVDELPSPVAANLRPYSCRFDASPMTMPSIRALHELMGYKRMTFVQETTFPFIIQGTKGVP